MEKFDVTVTTILLREEGKPFRFQDTMYWGGVDQEIVDWLAGSCRVTARWLWSLPEVVKGDRYTVRYQTTVTDQTGKKVAGTVPPVSFEHLSYGDMLRFQRWALGQLGEMIDLFDAKSEREAPVTRKRSKVKAIAVIAWALLKLKLNI